MSRRNIIILTILFALSLAGISFFSGPVPYIFFWLVILIPAMCAVYIFLVIIFLKIYQRTDGRTMTANEPSSFYITLYNDSIFSFSSIRIIFYSSFSTVSGLDDTTVYELAPHTSVTRQTVLTCRYRGEYLVGIKEIEVRDMLGLFTYRYKIREPLGVIVSPAIVHLESLRGFEDLPDADLASPSLKTIPDIPVREYVPGDDTRLLHHKMSAVMQKPMIRELTGTEKSGVAIFMESERYGTTTEEYLPAENRIIETVLALSLYYTNRSIPVDVFYRTSTLSKVSVGSYAEFEILYEALRGYSFPERGNTFLLLDEAGQTGSVSHNLLIFVLNRQSAEVTDKITTLTASGIPARIYLVDDNSGYDNVSMPGKNTDIVVMGIDKATEDVL